MWWCDVSQIDISLVRTVLIYFVCKRSNTFADTAKNILAQTKTEGWAQKKTPKKRWLVFPSWPALPNAAIYDWFETVLRFLLLISSLVSDVEAVFRSCWPKWWSSVLKVVTALESVVISQSYQACRAEKPAGLWASWDWVDDPVVGRD